MLDERTDRQSDRRDEANSLIIAICNVANTPKNQTIKCRTGK